MKKSLCLLIAAVLAATAALEAAEPARTKRGATATAAELQSPDGTIAVTVGDGNGLFYRVSMDGKPVLSDSPLGIEFDGKTWIGPAARIARVSRHSNDSTWENRFGIRRAVRDHFNEMRVELAEEGPTPLRFDLVVRAYDDGVALRYDLPRQPVLDHFVITEEATEFVFPDNWRCWGGDFSVCAENQYPERRLVDIRNPSVLPLLVELPHGYAALAEADLIDWAGMFIASVQPAADKSKPAAVKVSLARRKDRKGLVVSQTPRVSPWRVVMLGRKATDLPASDLIGNLATPSLIADTSWIKPGVTAWDPWWAGSVQARGNTETDRSYIDLAAAMGWQYQLVDWGWYKGHDVTEPNGSVDIPQLRDYARPKNVQLLLWMHSDDLNRTGVEKAFANVQSWQIPGVKIDFMNSDSQETVQWYYSTLETAARHKLLVDFHGAYKPTGLARTWPNYITQEGVLGNEYNKLSRTACTIQHTVTLPFTRGLLGPMDFTPGGFVNRTAKDFVQDAGARRGGNCQVLGTRARQLAMTVVYISPLLCLCDSPKSYLGQPGVEFLRGLPTVWDDTVVPSAAACRHIVVARRSGASWYLAAMNADEPLALKVPLDFLKAGQWTMRSFADTAQSATKPESIAETTRAVAPGEMLQIDLAPGGGFAAIVRPASGRTP